MSDTLQEGEDQMDNQRRQLEYETSEVFDYGTRQRARERLAALNTNTNQNPTVWHDCCKGYDHAPWCFEALKVPGAVTGESDKEVTDQTATITPQPAARGGGDEWRVQVAGSNVYILDQNGNAIANLHNERIAREIVEQREQHQALVAGRAQVQQAVTMLNNKISAILLTNYTKTSSYTTELMDVERELKDLLAYLNQQRSTSE